MQKAEETAQRLSDYAERRAELEERFRGPDGLSSLETKEYIDLIATVGLMVGDRATAIKRAMEGGGSDAKKLAWDSIGEAGVAGASAAVGAVGRRPGKVGGEGGSVDQNRGDGKDNKTAAPVNKPLGLGSTGRSEPENLSEKLALEQAISNPAAGLALKVPLMMLDGQLRRAGKNSFKTLMELKFIM